MKQELQHLPLLPGSKTSLSMDSVNNVGHHIRVDMLSYRKHQ
jgi:hypothetical protein